MLFVNELYFFFQLCFNAHFVFYTTTTKIVQNIHTNGKEIIVNRKHRLRFLEPLHKIFGNWTKNQKFIHQENDLKHNFFFSQSNGHTSCFR